MRILAAFIALLCCSAAGYRQSAKLKSRVKMLDEIMAMLRNFAIEIRCSALTLDELMKREKGRFAVFFNECRPMCDNSRSAWQAACGKLPQKTDEAALLAELGRLLGASDREGELQLLELYTERFSELRNSAVEVCGKKADAIFRIGILSGLGLAVLII